MLSALNVEAVIQTLTVLFLDCFYVELYPLGTQIGYIRKFESVRCNVRAELVRGMLAF